MTTMFAEPETWVAIAFLILMCVFAYVVSSPNWTMRGA